MAIISAAELLASREAIAAGVSDEDEAVAEIAILQAEALLTKALGYQVSNAATTLRVLTGDGSLLSLPERVQTITSITETPPGGSPAAVGDFYEARGKGFTLYRTGGWRPDSSITITGTFGYADDSAEFILAKQFVTIAGVRWLEATSSTNNMPTPAGAMLTSYTSEKAAFTYFTPTNTSTGFQDLDVLVDMIGKHPNKGTSLYTISLMSGQRDLTFDDIVAGRETVDDL